MDPRPFAARVRAADLRDAFQKVENETTSSTPLVLLGATADAAVTGAVALVPVLPRGTDRLIALWVGHADRSATVFDADHGYTVLLDPGQVNDTIGHLAQVEATATAFAHPRTRLATTPARPG